MEGIPKLPDLSSLTPEEQEMAKKILEEYAQHGSSDSLNKLYNEDFDEIPVDIDTFITDDRYLGRSTNHGNSIYPFWKNILRKLFSNDSKYNECILSGSIGIGKSSIAVLGMTYVLYNLMCLKNPQTFYGLQASDEIAISFFNISLDLSYGVAYKKFQDYLQNSPWFMERGTISGTKNPTYAPGKGIGIHVGSRTQHSLGLNIFCVGRDTQILTPYGPVTIGSLEDKISGVYDSKNNLVEGLVLNTQETNDYYEIELEDGTILKCSPEHQFLTENNEWIMAKDITPDTVLKDM